MKVNNISFGRVIPLTINKPKKQWEKAQELRDILNSAKIEKYPDEAKSKITHFFKDILGDYNGKGGIQVKKYKDSFCIISGDDAKTLKQLPKNEVDKYISKKIENGERRKPESEIKVNFSNNGKPTPSSIIYSTISESFSKIQDGIRTDNPNKQKNFFVITDCTYDEKILIP